MDCAGLGALIALRNLARDRNGVVRLVNPTPTVQLLFDAVRATDIFEMANARPTAHPLAQMFFKIPKLLQQRFCPGGTLESTIS
jgi:anti-anti-sigma regulatory factor